MRLAVFALLSILSGPLLAQAPIGKSLTGTQGDAARGRVIVADRHVGLCLLCHSAPIPEERFQGELAPGLTQGQTIKAGTLVGDVANGSRGSRINSATAAIAPTATVRRGDAKSQRSISTDSSRPAKRNT